LDGLRFPNQPRLSNVGHGSRKLRTPRGNCARQSLAFRMSSSTPYRPGGWTGRQVVHHVPDSHMNAFIRFKLALTEDQPAIKPYDEARWAVLPDAALPVEPSLDLLDALHLRWVGLLESMSERDYLRTFAHPESGVWRLDQYLAQYAWHGRHHVAHITSLGRSVR